MIGNGHRQTLGVIGLAIGTLVLFPVTALPLQEKISPVSDYQYKKDYAQVEVIRKETDPQKRADLLLAFVKEHPISRMLQYVSSDYLACVKPHLDQKDWNKAISMEEAFLALIPTAKAVEEAQVPEPGASDFLRDQLNPTRKTLMSALIAAYYQSNNMAKAAETAEKAYEADPDKNMLGTLVQIYQAANQADKFVAYSEKILVEFPIEQSFGTALQLADMYAQKGNLDKAVEYSSKVLETFKDKVPQGVQEADWNNRRAISYGYLAASAYSKKDYPKAIELYEQVSKFAPQADASYYYIGMSKWNTKDPEGAIEAFAKTAVLGKANAAKGKQYLEDLYKARHNNTLDGLDQVMAKAKADLGIQ